MLRLAMHITIETLWKQGKTKAEIARVTGHDWKTVAKVIKALKEHNRYPVKKLQPRKLDSYKEQIVDWLSHGYTALKIHEVLQGRGVQLCYSSVRDYVREFKKRDAVCIRFHTGPGEEAQVDFGYIGLTCEKPGKKRKTWLFNMRLSYSRLDFYLRVYDQTVETFIHCHIQAFKFFGGIPAYIKIDNLKAAILEANFYEPLYQQFYKQFADYYRFQVIPCRVYQPQEKGKTEAGIKYVKKNFMIGRTFTSSEDFDKQLRHWLTTVCNRRIHGTTRKIPQEVFEQQEKMHLLKLPDKPFHFPKIGERRVYRDSHIYVEYNYYSVPSQYVGKLVSIEVSDTLVKIKHQDEQIALHPKCQGKGEFITCLAHYPSYKNLLSTDYQKKHHAKMQAIGEDAEKLFLRVLTQRPQDWHRIVQGVINLEKHFSSDIVNLACKRALAYGVTGYRIIKNICETGSYQLPLEETHYATYEDAA